MKQKYRIVLASASPRRCELLKQAGLEFDIKPSNVEEKVTEDKPDKICESLAFQKASDVYEKECETSPEGDFIVVGADTIVYYDGEVLGKPKSEEEALDMLNMLADRTHSVYTGLSIIGRIEGKKKVINTSEETKVTFYPISRFEINEYIKTKDPFDKAGAYGIQGPFAIHVKGIEGDYNNVVGLPISKLYQVMKENRLI